MRYKVVCINNYSKDKLEHPWNTNYFWTYYRAKLDFERSKYSIKSIGGFVDLYKLRWFKWWLVRRDIL